MIIFFFLLIPRASRVLAGMERWQHGYEKDFSVINHGRMHIHTVLRFLKDKDLPECIEFCIKHRQCITVSYCAALKQCELNDMNFNDEDGDPDAVGWINYSTPPLVHGGFSNWMKSTECTTTCGPGTMMLHRFCDNPRPDFGGNWCKGDYQKKETCDLAPCPEDDIAVGKPSSQSSTGRDKPDTQLAELGNDGDFNTRSSTDIERNPYLEIDLEKPIAIRSITLYLNDYSFKRGMYSNLVVMVRKTSSDSWSICKEIGKPASIKIELKCDDDGDKVRYICILNKVDSSQFALKEIKVFKWQTKE